jgi:putative FmdB family regulatory protein
MALYHFSCSGCEEATRRLLEPSEASSQICKKCGDKLTRVPNPPTAAVVEVLDNGVMSKKVERFKEAERLYRERAKNDPRHKKD